MSGGASDSAATAVMNSRETQPFTVVPTSIVTPSQLDQQMHLNFASYGPPVPVGSSPPNYQSIPVISAGALIKQVSGEQLKRKRGRPRKYGPDGNIASPQQQQHPMGGVMPQNFSSPPPAVAIAPQTMQADSQMPVSGSVSPTVKKARGRPPGSSNKKQKVEPLGEWKLEKFPFLC